MCMLTIATQFHEWNLNIFCGCAMKLHLEFKYGVYKGCKEYI